MAEVKPLGYRSGLDGLRGVAVGLVIVYHFDRSWLPGGWVGVDLFFVLSGFLITTLLLEEHQRTGVWMSGFYQRRCLRLLPAMVAFLAVVAAWHAVDPAFMAGIRQWLPRVYITNATLAFGLGDAGFAHIWSLAAEEQFYLLWPPLLVLMLRRRLSQRTILTVTIGLIAASTLTSVALWARGAGWMRLYFGPDTHAAPILIGCLLGQLWVWGMLPARIEWSAVPAVGLLSAAALFAEPQMEIIYAGGLTAVGFAGAALICAVLRVRGLDRVLSWRHFVQTGRYSYALYLWHPFLFFFAGRHGRWWMAVAVAASYVIAALSMRLVEGPFLALKDRVVRPTPAPVLAPRATRTASWRRATAGKSVAPK